MSAEYLRLATPSTGKDEISAEISGKNQTRTAGDTGSEKERPLLLRRLDVANLLNIGGRTFDRLLACGQFPPADIVLNSKLIRWKRSSVEKWIAAH